MMRVAMLSSLLVLATTVVGDTIDDLAVDPVTLAADPPTRDAGIANQTFDGGHLGWPEPAGLSHLLMPTGVGGALTMGELIGDSLSGGDDVVLFIVIPPDCGAPPSGEDVEFAGSRNISVGADGFCHVSLRWSRLATPTRDSPLGPRTPKPPIPLMPAVALAGVGLLVIAAGRARLEIRRT